MLEAGGMAVLTDGLRTADGDNPNGYYEFERVKDLDKAGGGAWLADARGRAVKIISLLLTHLPESHDYRVIFMRRDLGEIIASQNVMLDTRQEARGAADDRTRELYESHLRQVERFLAQRSCFSTQYLDYGEVLAAPREQASRLNAFLGGGLAVEPMAAVAEPALYRNR
ncbi:MAG: sulfotransferase family protein [Acidobacteriota bacterium]